MADPVIFYGPDALFVHVVVSRRMGLECKPFHLLQVEDEHIEAPLGHNTGVKLPEGSGRAVPGILKNRLPGGFCSGVRLFEVLLRHVDLAPDFEVIRHVA